ncbi:hypothetical protein B0H66DRAFT_530890 [Apodospora peruviana]|uniref:Uncharacterized protein n=1 Tax=Apodospora peruviana TaxID=516989 RepID=A0AAE0IL40_9PEZI|nr:hypothetical protein B0H66DRAFT_530890 [Apodospora peruviana]
MRASSKTSALILTFAAAGFLARVSVVSAHPLCSSDLSDQNCRDDLLVDHWVPRRDHHHHDHQARAFRLPGAKRPGDDTPEVPGPSPKPKTDGDDTPEGQSGPQAGTPWGQSPAPPRPSQGASTNPEYNVENKGYVIYADQIQLPGRPKEPMYTVEKDNQVAAELRTNKDEGSITVDTAFVGWEGTDDRARLWEVQATVAFLKSGMNPVDVKQLRTTGITEKSSIDTINASRQKLGKGQDEDFTVRKDSTGAEKEVFDMNLNNSAFGKNAQQFLEKSPVTGKEVKEIRVESGGNEELRYVFVLG